MMIQMKCHRIPNPDPLICTMNYSKMTWAVTCDFQHCGICDQQSLKSAYAYAQSDQSICLSLEYSMSVKLLTEHHLEFLSLKEAAQARLSLHVSKCHIVGHPLSRLNYGRTHPNIKDKCGKCECGIWFASILEFKVSFQYFKPIYA